MSIFWDEKSLNKPVSKAAIKAVEDQLNIKFPDFLIDKYQIHNGGYLHKSLFIENQPEHSTAYLQGLLPLEEFETLKSIADTIEFDFEEEDWDLTIDSIEKLIVISNIGFSQFTCLDYRKSQTNPKLVVYDTTLIPKLIEDNNSFKESIFNLKMSNLKEEIGNEIGDSIEEFLPATQENIDLIKQMMKDTLDVSKISDPVLQESIKITLIEVKGKKDDDHLKKIVLKSVLKCAVLMHKKQN